MCESNLIDLNDVGISDKMSIAILNLVRNYCLQSADRCRKWAICIWVFPFSSIWIIELFNLELAN